MLFFFYNCAVLWCAQIIEYILARWSHSFVCTLHTSLSSPCRRIWRYSNSNMFLRYISVEWVSKIRSILSIIFHATYGSLCIQLTDFSYDDFENTYTLFYYHHQIGSMNHLPLFRVRSWNIGMCCMSVSILRDKIYVLYIGIQTLVGVVACEFDWVDLCAILFHVHTGVGVAPVNVPQQVCTPRPPWLWA